MPSSLTLRNLKTAETGSSGAASLVLLGTLVLAAASPAGAQTASPQKTAPPHGASAASTHAASAQQPPVAAQPAAPLNIMDQPAIPANVVHHDDVLAVSANNSSLTQILHQVARETGMQIDGLSGDERVFGSFGPGNPRDVLASLLNGTSYNVLMVGDLANGAPRQLLLTHKNGPALANAGNPAPRHAKGPEAPDENDVDDSQTDNDAPQPQPEDDVTQQPPGSSDTPAPSEMPRTPQQMLEQMQQLQNSEPPQADSPADSPQ
jgi:hypothetical protein